MVFQMVEILEHKYYMSKEAGYDVGLEKTLFDWVASGHARRFQESYYQHKDTIDYVCNKCNKCTSLYDCMLPNAIVHQLMDDDSYSLEDKIE